MRSNYLAVRALTQSNLSCFILKYWARKSMKGMPMIDHESVRSTSDLDWLSCGGSSPLLGAFLIYNEKSDAYFSAALLENLRLKIFSQWNRWIPLTPSGQMNHPTRRFWILQSGC